MLRLLINTHWELNSFPELTKETTDKPISILLQGLCIEQYLFVFLTCHPLIIRRLYITQVNVDKDERVFVQDYLD